MRAACVLLAVVAVWSGMPAAAAPQRTFDAKAYRAPETGPLAAMPASTTGVVSGDAILQELVSHNEWRQSRLQGYSEKRIYRVVNEHGAVSAEEDVSVKFEAPDIKRYTVTAEHGSSVIRRLVFQRLLDSEVETAGGRLRRESAITPANYRFQFLGEDQLDGRPCYVVEATPTRKAKYLFEGKVWIDSEDFAVAKIEGQPANNPSWWTRKIHFVRRYEKVGDFWLPLSDESVNEVRIFGVYILSIEHQDYEVTTENQKAEGRNQK